MKIKHKKYIIFFLLIVILFFLFYRAYKNINIEKFENINNVCIVWNNKIDDKTNQGFGDRIRGVIYVYRYFMNLNSNIKITVNANDDTCGDILNNVHSNNKPEQINYVYISNAEKELEEMKNLISKDGIIYIFTNCSIKEPILLTDDEKKFAKYISDPNDTIKMEIKQKIEKLPKNFTIKHFRFNDSIFNKDVDINDITFKKYFELLKKDYLDTDILMTNSNNFTKYAKEYLNINYIDCNNDICKVEHTGNSNEYEKVKNSFIEYNIVSMSKKIMSYTCYEWPSNFVLWTSKIYDIPFESIENL